MTFNPLNEAQQLDYLKSVSLPYTFDVNRPTLVQQAHQVWQDVADLKADACQDNFAQASICMHPEFSGRKFFPDQLLQKLGLFVVGIRQTQVYPRFSLAIDDEAEIGTAIIVVAKRPSFQVLADRLEEIEEETLIGQQLMTIESMEAVTAYDRMDIEMTYGGDNFMIGLYPRPGSTIAESKDDFTKYAVARDFKVRPDFCIEKGGMYYVLIRGERYNLDAIAENPFVSTIRKPPKRK